MAPPKPDPEADLLALLSPRGFAGHHFRGFAFSYQEEVMNAILRKDKRRIAWVAGRRAGKGDTVACIALILAVPIPTVVDDISELRLRWAGSDSLGL